LFVPAETAFVADSFKVTCSSFEMFVEPAAIVNVSVTAVVEVTASETVFVATVLVSCGPTFVQFIAFWTALPALMRPNPYCGLNAIPAPFTVQPALVGSFLSLVTARIFWTSRQPRFGLACKISAMIPATAGVANDVPCRLSAPTEHIPPFAVVMYPERERRSEETIPRAFAPELSPPGATTKRHEQYSE
jgi:hypothetical protein